MPAEMRGRARTNVNYSMSDGRALYGMRGRARTNATYTRPAVATDLEGVRLKCVAGHAQTSIIAVQLDVRCMECMAGHAQTPSILGQL